MQRNEGPQCSLFQPLPKLAEGVLAVEERGLVLVMSALRIAWAGGGDGEAALRADARSLAAYVRDPAAAVTAAILPFSASAKYDTQVRIGLPSPIDAGLSMFTEARVMCSSDVANGAHRAVQICWAGLG